MASGYRVIKGRTEMADLELGPTSARNRGKGIPRSQPLRKSKNSLAEDLKHRLRTRWDEEIAATAHDEVSATDTHIKVVVVSFFNSAPNGDPLIQWQSCNSTAELRRLLKTTPPANLETRLIILPLFRSFRLSTVLETPSHETVLSGQVRVLASIVASAGLDVDRNSRDRFLHLAGVEDTFSDFQAPLDILQLADSSFNQIHAWDFRYCTTTVTPTVYESDYALYTSTFYVKPPGQRWLRFGCHDGQTGVPHIVATCNDLDLYEAFCHSFTSDHVHNVNNSPNPWDLVLQQAHTAIDQKSAENLLALAHSVYDMKYLVRREPSRLKYNFLLHLQDHLEVLRQTLQPRVPESVLLGHLSDRDNTTHKIANPGRDHPGSPSYAVHLLAAVLSLQSATAAIYDTAKDQVGGKDSAKNKLLAVLAAIYLPFSLASSILGMNVTQLSNSSSVKWPVFVAIGLPLVAVTVALPLSFEWLARVVRRFGIRRPAGLKGLLYLGIAAAVVVLVVIIAVVVELNKH